MSTTQATQQTNNNSQTCSHIHNATTQHIIYFSHKSMQLYVLNVTPTVWH